MAKNDKQPNAQENTEQASAAPETAAPATTTSSESDASDERFKMIKDPESGQVMRRVDYIRNLWKTGQHTRGEIAKKLGEIQGKKVPYQIVFAATKNIPGGKKADGSIVTVKASSEAPTTEGAENTPAPAQGAGG